MLMSHYLALKVLMPLRIEIAIKLGWNPHSQYKHAHYGIPQLFKKYIKSV